LQCWRGYLSSRKQIPLSKSSFTASQTVISSTILTVVVSKLVVFGVIVEPVKDAVVVADGELIVAEDISVDIVELDNVDDGITVGFLVVDVKVVAVVAVSSADGVDDATIVVDAVSITVVGTIIIKRTHITIKRITPIFS
jgi:hypothetical protein